ncbi:MAG TPA: hypothetical protein PK174_00890 [Anaerolineaceae bacterium]|nr:hypothetical protein [Anaerolineaceae bacterium]
MSPASFSNMTEMLSYLNNLENRIIALESENRILKSRADTFSKGDRLTVQQEIDRYLPRTNILSSSYISRAFAVWGHYFVAQLVIGVGMAFIYLIIAVVILGMSRSG